MSQLRRTAARIRALFVRTRLERELADEVRFHLEMQADENERRGMTAAEARNAARRNFGGLDRMTEAYRDARGISWIEPAAQDLRYALRTLRRSPGFAAVAVLSLALGIGANAAIFSLIDTLLLRTLPVRDPQQLVHLQMMMPGANTPSSLSYPLVRGLAEQDEIFAGVCGFANAAFDLGRPDSPETVTGTWFSGDCHEMFGLVPIAGRLLNRDDDRAGAPPVVVISDSFWNRRFGRDPAAIGTALLISGVAATIVGVTPPRFAGATVGEVSEFAIPIAGMARLIPDRASVVEASMRWLQALARPLPGVSRVQVQAHLSVSWPNVVRAAVPDSMAAARKRQMASVMNALPGGTGSSGLRREFSQPLVVLMAVAGLILLIACANLANLLLARAAGRRREIAVRLAMGAGRGRVIRQLVTESLLLSLLGAIPAVAIGAYGSRFLVSMLSSARDSQVFLDLTPDWRILGFVAAIATSAGLAFGLVPAFRATASGPGRDLAGTSTRITGSGGRLGSALVVVQVALSLLLVVGAGLFVRTLQNLRTLDPGFRREGVLLVEVNGRKLGYRGPQLTAFYQEILQEMQAVPGVASASLSFTTPVGPAEISQRVGVQGQPPPTEETLLNLVAPRYFETLHTPVIAGREFTAGDTAAAPPVAIVNQAFVRRHLQGQQPVGTRIIVGSSVREIVGVVQDAVYSSLREPLPPTVYSPYLQTPENRAVFALDSRVPLAQLAAAVRARIQPRSPGAPVLIRTRGPSRKFAGTGTTDGCARRLFRTGRTATGGRWIVRTAGL